jgi:hypothetical protein
MQSIWLRDSGTLSGAMFASAAMLRCIRAFKSEQKLPPLLNERKARESINSHD